MILMLSQSNTIHVLNAHSYSNPTSVSISREGIAKRLDLAEERPPTKDDYRDQLAIRCIINERMEKHNHIR